jgi:uracil-DNA glycosylase family 4
MERFTPIILPEEAAPPHAAQCELCELSRQRKRVVWGEGNVTAPYIAILDNPGAREDKEGQSFVCGTRETLQAGIAKAGLDLNMFYVTYLLKCRPIRKYEKEVAREACRPHLQLQIGEKQPQVLCILGNVAVQAMFRDEEAEVKHLRGRWHVVDGIPAVVSYHPLAVRRRPVLMKSFVDDLRLVAETNKSS